MKNFLLVLNAVFAVLIVILFVLVFGIKNKQCDDQPVLRNDSTLSYSKLPIAYINIDSLLLNYDFSKSANESLIKKEEDSRLKFNTQARRLQEEVAEFQRKLENNAFLSRERAEKEQTRLMQKQQELQELDGKLTQELFEEQQKFNEQLRDTVDNFLKEFNKNGTYEIIFSNSSLGMNENILQANAKYDITKEVVEILNKRISKK